MVTASTTAMEKLYQEQTSQSIISDEQVSRDDFLKLLIAQLQHQDPLNPVENQEFVAELATFSSLEQQQTQTELLSQLVSLQNTTGTSQALSLIGKEATIATDDFFFQEGNEIQFVFNATSAGSIPVTISNTEGQVVYQDTINASEAGQITYIFDGQNAQGQSLSTGDYSISIGASLDADGNETSLPVYMRGGVEGVTFLEGTPILIVNGQAVPLSSVQGVYEKS